MAADMATDSALSELTAALARLAAAATAEAAKRGETQKSGLEGVYADVAACLKGASGGALLECSLALETELGGEAKQRAQMVDDEGSPTEECESLPDGECTTTPVCQRTIRRVGSSPKSTLSDVKASKRKRPTIGTAVTPTRGVRTTTSSGREKKQPAALDKSPGSGGMTTKPSGHESRRAAARATLAALGQEEPGQAQDSGFVSGQALPLETGISAQKSAKNSLGPRNSLVVRADSRSNQEASKGSPRRSGSAADKGKRRATRRSKSHTDKARGAARKRTVVRATVRTEIRKTEARGGGAPDRKKGGGEDRARTPRGSVGAAIRAAKPVTTPPSVRMAKVQEKSAQHRDAGRLRGCGDEARHRKHAKRRKSSPSIARTVRVKTLPAADVVSFGDASTRTPSPQDETTPSPRLECTEAENEAIVRQKSAEPATKAAPRVRLKPRNSLDIQPQSTLKLLPRSKASIELEFNAVAGSRTVTWGPARWGSEGLRTRCDPGKGPHAAWDNDGFFVIYKPPGWTATTTSNRGDQRTKIQNWLLETYGEAHPYLLTDTLQAGIVHRLDIQTSGPMVVASRLDTYQHLCCSISRQTWYKEYLALIHGALPPSRCRGTLSYRLQVPRRWGAKLWRTEVSASGLTAETRYQALRIYRRKLDSDVTRYYTLVRVRLITGRTHQIRVHFRELARRLELDVCGLVGDHIYLPRAQLNEDYRFCDRIFLHERRLRFPHPDPKKGPLNVVCPLPPDLMRALSELELERKVTGAVRSSASAPASGPADLDASAPPSPWRPPAHDD